MVHKWRVEPLTLSLTTPLFYPLRHHSLPASAVASYLCLAQEGNMQMVYNSSARCSQQIWNAYMELAFEAASRDLNLQVRPGNPLSSTSAIFTKFVNRNSQNEYQ